LDGYPPLLEDVDFFSDLALSTDDLLWLMSLLTTDLGDLAQFPVVEVGEKLALPQGIN
jgi:hypothetical protein